MVLQPLIRMSFGECRQDSTSPDLAHILQPFNGWRPRTERCIASGAREGASTRTPDKDWRDNLTKRVPLSVIDC